MPIEISQFFDDPSVTDVAFNAFDRLALKRQGLWLSAESPFASQDDFSQWLVDLVEAADGRLDFARPSTSVSAGGFRIHAIIGGQIAKQPSATIRRLNSPASDFLFADAPSQRRFEFLKGAVAQRKNILIAGPAGAGKTSLLRSLLSELGHERLITIEDVAELDVQTSNCVALVAREANVEGAGAVGLNDLVAEALRMSPDRLIVGEIRGAELLVILNALNTGHGGAGATIHANSLGSVCSRLETIAASQALALPALARMVVDAFDFVVFVDRRPEYRIVSLGRFKLLGESLKVEVLDE